MRYTNLIFDLYGTLVDIHTDQSLPEVWEKTALYFGFYGAAYGPEELQKAFARLTVSMEQEKGQSYECFPELRIEEIFETLWIRKGITEKSGQLAVQTAQLFRLVSMEYIRLYPGVKEVLAKLKADGHKLWLLSNAQRVFTAYELRALGLENCFDGIYISSDYGCRKPDVRFFEKLIAGQELDVKDSLMIGNDLTTDIGGAQKAGLNTFYVHTNLSPANDRMDDKHARPTYAMEETDWGEIEKYLHRICL